MNTVPAINLEVFKHVPVFFAVSIALFMGAGWLFGRYRIRKSGDSGVAIREPLIAAIFGLSALVLGFTFSSAFNHYDTRIEGIRSQANTIKEVYLSTQYLQPSDQSAIKKSLANLLNLRLEAYSNIKNMNDFDIATDRVATLVRQINEDVTKAVINAPIANRLILAETISPQTRNLVTTFNFAAIKMKSHPPILIMCFLFILLFAGALLTGYTMAVKGESDWFLAFVYVLLMSFGLYVILSLEYPNVLMPYEELNRDLLLLKKQLSSI
jgi:hypothetical protein